MANTYTWDFPTLDVNNSAQNGHDDVIQTVHWRMTAVSDSETDADGNALSVSAYGSIGLATPDAGDASFVAFDSVTKDNCKSWVLSNLGKTEAEMQTMLDEQVTALASPPVGQRTPSGW